MQIFISYEPDKSKTFVAKLTEELKIAGHHPVIKNLRLMYGNDLLKKIDVATKNCDRVIVVLTRSFMASKWQQQELFAFQVKELACKTNIIVPILIETCDVPLILEDRVCDFRKVPFERAFDKLLQVLPKPRQVFVVMKVGDRRLDSAYDLAIRPTVEEYGYRAIRVDKLEHGGKISDEILKQITESELILADLTGERPNCYYETGYYETGYAHALEKELVLTIHQGSDIHFDLSGYQFIIWETETELKEKLKRRLVSIQERQAEMNRGSGERRALKNRRKDTVGRTTAPL